MTRLAIGLNGSKPDFDACLPSPYLVLPPQSGLHYRGLIHRDHMPGVSAAGRLPPSSPLPEVILFLPGVHETHTYAVTEEVKTLLV